MHRLSQDTGASPIMVLWCCMWSQVKLVSAVKNESSLERCAMRGLWWRELPLNHTNKHIHQSFLPLTKCPYLGSFNKGAGANNASTCKCSENKSKTLYFIFLPIFRFKAQLIISRKWWSQCLLWQRTSHTAHTHTAWLAKTVQMASVSSTSIPTMLVDTGIFMLTSKFWATWDCTLGRTWSECKNVISCLSMLVFSSFANLGIQCVRRKELDASLKRRREKKIDPFNSELLNYIAGTLAGCPLQICAILLQYFLNVDKKKTIVKWQHFH